MCDNGRMTIRTYDGAVVVITGGASGIGRAAGEALARRGAEVVLADLQGPQVEQAAHEISQAGGRVSAATLDVRDAAAVERLFKDTLARTGRLDYVFNNAGTGIFGEIHLLEQQDWDLLIDVNLKGMINVIRAAYPRLIAQGFGHLVNTSSTAGYLSAPFVASYCATKHAIVGLTKGLRIEAARFGVRVSVLCPGVLRTPLLTAGAQGRTVYPLSPERMLEWWTQMGIAELEPFTTQMLEAVARNQAEIVLPKRNRVVLALARLFPGFEYGMNRALFHRTLKKFPEIAGATERKAA